MGEQKAIRRGFPSNSFSWTAFTSGGAARWEPVCFLWLALKVLSLKFWRESLGRRIRVGNISVPCSHDYSQKKGSIFKKKLYWGSLPQWRHVFSWLLYHNKEAVSHSRSLSCRAAPCPSARSGSLILKVKEDGGREKGVKRGTQPLHLFDHNAEQANGKPSCSSTERRICSKKKKDEPLL